MWNRKIMESISILISMIRNFLKLKRNGVLNSMWKLIMKGDLFWE